jgi:hypothetical protein
MLGRFGLRPGRCPNLGNDLFHSPTCLIGQALTRHGAWSAVAAATAFCLRFIRQMGKGEVRKAVAAATALQDVLGNTAG